MINLSELKNLFGQVKPQIQKRLEKLLRECNEKNWDNAHTIILDGNATLWQYVCAIDCFFPKSAKLNEDCETVWERIPDKGLLVQALELAQDNCENNLQLICGVVKEKVI